MKEIDINKGGISCLQLAKKLNKNRVTVAKYLEVLKANNEIDSKQVAQANLWTIKKDSKMKILIVDDEPNIVTLIKLSLVSLNANIICAYDGLEGIQKIYEEKPSIVILDLMMPKMSGYDVYEKLKMSEQTKDIPIILLTAKSDISKKIDKIILKKDMFMTKPFDPIELETNIKLLLSQVQGVHPITELPTQKYVINKINELLKDGIPFYVSVLKFEEMQELKKKMGFTKVTDIIKKFANVVKEAVKDNFLFMSQTNDNNIVVITSSRMNNEIKSSYESISKYLTNEELTLLVDEYEQRELKSIDIANIIK